MLTSPFPLSATPGVSFSDCDLTCLAHSNTGKIIDWNGKKELAS